jgi:hypothetical protein
LFEEESNLRIQALVADRSRPVWVHTAGAMTTFTANDDPADAFEIQPYRTKQWLTRKETDACLDLAQVIDAGGPALVFDGYAYPDVVRNVQPA